MFDSLPGLEQLPLAAKFVLAFVVVLALIVITFWLIRRFGGARVGGGQARGRQPRLAVIDAAAVDSRRRLVLIRRDNVEHLVMIGGPSDVVIEQNIVRAVPVSPARDAPVRGPGETVARGTDMVRPESMSPPPPAAETWSPPPMSEGIRPEGIRSRAEPPPRQIESSRPLPESLTAMRSPPEPRASSPRVSAELPPVEVRQSPPTADVNLADMAQRLEAALRRPGQPIAEARNEPPPRPAPPPMRSAPPPRPAPPMDVPPPPVARTMPPTRPAPAAAEPPAPRPAPPVNIEPPRPPAPAPAPPPAPVAAAETPAAPPPQPRSESAEPPAPEPAAAPKPPIPSKSVFDSLEEEMASLLGRPADKP